MLTLSRAGERAGGEASRMQGLPAGEFQYLRRPGVMQLVSYPFSPTTPFLGQLLTTVRARRGVPAKGSINMGQEIVQIQPPPIARCHACPLAKTSVLHYQESATQNVIIKPALDVYCIGGASPPRN